MFKYILVAATSAVLSAILGATIALLVVGSAPAPDITILPCSAWAHTEYPYIPPYTFTGACVAADGTISGVK